MMNRANAPLESRRERTRKAKIQAILDTAMELVVEGGIEGLTIQGIGRKMDCAVGALYRYFASKDVLLAELQCRVINEYHDALSGSLDRYDSDHPNDPLGALVLVARHYGHYLSENPAHFRLISLALSDSKHLLPGSEGMKVMAAVQPILGLITQIIERAQKTVFHKGDAAERTVVFWACVQGVMQMKKLERFAPQQLNNERLLTQTLSTFLSAWGVAEDDLANALALGKGVPHSLLLAAQQGLAKGV
jgi:AcrR family transcriptional regulator